MLRHDGYYVSTPLSWVRHDGGRRSEEEYFLLYWFFPDGTWICKTADDAGFDLESFLFGLDLDEIRHNPDADEPQLPNGELLYQSGTYWFTDERVSIEWKNLQVQEEPMRWSLRIADAERLETVTGETLFFFREQGAD